MVNRAALLVALVLPLSALAQPAPRPDSRGTLSFATENDKFGGGTDRFYSNGLLFSYGSASVQLPTPLAWLDRQLDVLQGPGQLRWGVSLEHAIFTPQDTSRPLPDPRDRPYAGLLLGTLSLHRVMPQSLSTVEIQLGLVGPAAGGEQVQNNWHAVVGVPRARGWRYQLSNEFAGALVLDRKWRVPLGEAGPVALEAVPSATLSLGNLQTYGALGGVVRAGQGLRADFGPARLRPALAGSTFFQPSEERGRERLGWYVFAGAEGRLVAHDITLQGNSFRGSRGVDARPLVMDLQAGAALMWRGVRVAYTQVWRTDEFYGQRGGFQVFGSLNLSARF